MLSKSQIVKFLNKNYGMDLAIHHLIDYNFYHHDYIPYIFKFESTQAYVINKDQGSRNLKEYIVVNKIKPNSYSIKVVLELEYKRVPKLFRFKNRIQLDKIYFNQICNFFKSDFSVMESFFKSQKFGDGIDNPLSHSKYICCFMCQFDKKFIIRNTFRHLDTTIDFRLNHRPSPDILDSSHYTIKIENNNITTAFYEEFNKYALKNGFEVDFENIDSITNAKKIIEFIKI